MTGSALAGGAEPPKDAPKRVAPPSGGNGQSSAERIDARLVDNLVRSTIIALHHANITGNYSVVRDLGTPTFQQLNSAAGVADAYAWMRRDRINLLPMLHMSPTYTREPQLDNSGALRVDGHFETKPRRIAFQLKFRESNGHWAIAAMVIALQPEPGTQTGGKPSADGTQPAGKALAKPANSQR